MLADAGVPAVVHTGNGPNPGAFTGVAPFAQVLARHPRLNAVIAHMGMPDHAEFLDLALRHPNLRLDTTMVFVDFFDGAEAQSALALALGPRLAALADRILLGSDFPNIPTRTHTGWRRWSAAGSGRTGCGQCFGTTVHVFGIPHPAEKAGPGA